MVAPDNFLSIRIVFKYYLKFLYLSKPRSGTIKRVIETQLI